MNKPLLALTLLGSFSLFSFTLLKIDGDVKPEINFFPQQPAPQPSVTNVTIVTPPAPVMPANTAVSLPHTVTGTGAQKCSEVASDYECRRIALLYAERDLAEGVKKTLLTASALTEKNSTPQLTEALASHAQAIIRNRIILKEGDENGRYTYHLRAEVTAF
jgi:hypothetical protein